MLLKSDLLDSQSPTSTAPMDTSPGSQDPSVQSKNGSPMSTSAFDSLVARSRSRGATSPHPPLLRIGVRGSLLFFLFPYFSFLHFFIFDKNSFFHFYNFSPFVLFFIFHLFRFFHFLMFFSFFFVFSLFSFIPSQGPPKTFAFSYTNLNFKARFWVRGEERRKKAERADRNKSPSTIARTGTFCYSRAWRKPLTPTRRVSPRHHRCQRNGSAASENLLWLRIRVFVRTLISQSSTNLEPHLVREAFPEDTS